MHRLSAKVMDIIDSRIQRTLAVAAKKQFGLTEKEETFLFSASEEEISTLKKELRTRFFEEIAAPVMRDLHKLRFYMLFLDAIPYAGLQLRMVKIFGELDYASDNLISHLVSISLEKQRKIKEEIQLAKKLSGAFGPTIEE